MTRKTWRTALALGAFLASSHPTWGVVGPTLDGVSYADRVVMILTRGPEGSGFCSGVVLSPRIILTAAHCLRRPEDMRVHFLTPEGAAVVLEVAAAVAHPGYVPNAAAKRTRSIDIGLVEPKTKLPGWFRAAELSDHAPPAPGEATVVVGFGVSIEGRPTTGGTLRAVKLSVIEPRSNVLLWLADARTPRGACSGDSGGPIFSQDAETVAAITAWTEGQASDRCGKLTQGVLVAPIRGWIAAAEKLLRNATRSTEGE